MTERSHCAHPAAEKPFIIPFPVHKLLNQSGLGHLFSPHDNPVPSLGKAPCADAECGHDREPVQPLTRAPCAVKWRGRARPPAELLCDSPR